MARILFVGAATLATLSSTGIALAQGRDLWDWRDHPYWGWGHMMFGGATMILFWGAIVVLAIMLIRWLGVGDRLEGTRTPPPVSPLDILKERYARGEIDSREFDERRKKLSE